MASRLFLVHIDLNKNELQNAVVQVLASAPGSPSTGQVYCDSTLGNVLRLWNGSAWFSFGRLDQIAAPTASVDLNSQKIINLGAPVGANDAVRLTDLQAYTTGLSWKTAVRAATTTSGTLATSFANGQTIDGVALVTGDRILIKNQGSAAENGIYTVNATGAPTRATDADTWAELLSAAVFIEQGTINADTGWVATQDPGGSLGVTAVTFAQFTGTANVVGGAGLTLTGNTLDVGAGTGIAVAADSVGIDTTVVPRMGTANLTGSATSYAVAHGHGNANLPSRPWVQRNSDGLAVDAQIVVDGSNINITFNVAPTTNQYRVNWSF